VFRIHKHRSLIQLDAVGMATLYRHSVRPVIRPTFCLQSDDRLTRLLFFRAFPGPKCPAGGAGRGEDHLRRIVPALESHGPAAIGFGRVVGDVEIEAVAAARVLGRFCCHGDGAPVGTLPEAFAEMLAASGFFSFSKMKSNICHSTISSITTSGLKQFSASSTFL